MYIMCEALFHTHDVLICVCYIYMYMVLFLNSTLHTLRYHYRAVCISCVRLLFTHTTCWYVYVIYIYIYIYRALFLNSALHTPRHHYRSVCISCVRLFCTHTTCWYVYVTYICMGFYFWNSALFTYLRDIHTSARRMCKKEPYAWIT